MSEHYRWPAVCHGLRYTGEQLYMRCPNCWQCPMPPAKMHAELTPEPTVKDRSCNPEDECACDSAACSTPTLYAACFMRCTPFCGVRRLTTAMIILSCHWEMLVRLRTSSRALMCKQGRVQCSETATALSAQHVIVADTLARSALKQLHIQAVRVRHMVAC